VVLLAAVLATAVTHKPSPPTQVLATAVTHTPSPPTPVLAKVVIHKPSLPIAVALTIGWHSSSDQHQMPLHAVTRRQVDLVLPPTTMQQWRCRLESTRAAVKRECGQTLSWTWSTVGRLELARCRIDITRTLRRIPPTVGSAWRLRTLPWLGMTPSGVNRSLALSLMLLFPHATVPMAAHPHAALAMAALPHAALAVSARFLAKQTRGKSIISPKEAKAVGKASVAQVIHASPIVSHACL
jgi:hypothetical protein